MSGWLIECDDNECGAESWAAEIDDLMRNHRHNNGRFRCCKCGGSGRIRRRYANMQGANEEPWEPQLVGAIQPDWCETARDGSYQPFGFLTEETEEGDEPGVWMRYYKDTRHESGGRLKFGDGPGGGPAFNPMDLVDMVAKLAELGIVERDAVRARLEL